MKEVEKNVNVRSELKHWMKLLEKHQPKLSEVKNKYLFWFEVKYRAHLELLNIIAIIVIPTFSLIISFFSKW